MRNGLSSDGGSDTGAQVRTGPRMGVPAETDMSEQACSPATVAQRIVVRWPSEPNGRRDPHRSAMLRRRADRHGARRGTIMAAELILEFEGVTTKEYYAVNKELGIDPESGEETGPMGWWPIQPDSTKPETSS